MKTRYRLYRRNGTFYFWDNDTGKRESLQTKDAKQARALLATKNEAHDCSNAMHSASYFVRFL